MRNTASARKDGLFAPKDRDIIKPDKSASTSLTSPTPSVTTPTIAEAEATDVATKYCHALIEYIGGLEQDPTALIDKLKASITGREATGVGLPDHIQPFVLNILNEYIHNAEEHKAEAERLNRLKRK